MRGRASRGFTLLEVVVAVLLLSLSLTALLEVQSRSIVQTAQARDMTVAVALARGKIVDIEQMLFHRGQVTGDETEEGDFADLGHPEIHFRYQISEVDFDLSRVQETVGQVAQARGADGAAAQGQFTSLFGAIGGIVEPFVQSISRALRVVDLEVSWPSGTARPHLSLRTLLSQDDFSTMAAGEAARDQRVLQEAAGAQGAQGGQAAPPAARP